MIQRLQKYKVRSDKHVQALLISKYGLKYSIDERVPKWQ